MLIVNADLRKTQPCSAWDETPGRGLATFLETEFGALGELAPIADVPGVWLLPSGGATPKAAELLGSSKFESLLQRLRDDFDYILVNSPPALLYTDAQILASSVDACVLVVLASRTSKQDARDVLQRLKSVSAPFLGVLLNGAPVRSARYSKFGYQL